MERKSREPLMLQVDLKVTLKPQDDTPPQPPRPQSRRRKILTGLARIALKDTTSLLQAVLHSDKESS